VKGGCGGGVDEGFRWAQPILRGKARGGCTTREEPMTILSRRTFLAGAASASVLPSFALWSAQSVRAATPAAGKQAASFYRYKVGDIEVPVLSDGIARVPVTEAFVLNVKPEEVNAALREAYMEPGVFIGPYNPIVLNTGTKHVLVDM